MSEWTGNSPYARHVGGLHKVRFAGLLKRNHLFFDGIGETVPRTDEAGRGGFMRRFLTLVCLLCLAIPAGISISGCTRNPGANYCNGLGYGLKYTDLAKLVLQPQTTGVSLAYGQTRIMGAPQGSGCHGDAVNVSSFTWGTTNNQVVDISPAGNICAGAWNRNSGGGIPNYTICTPPTNSSSPYASAYVTATADSVVSNAVQVFVHAAVTSLAVVGPTQCLSQGTQWPQPLDVQAYYASTINGQPMQTLLCAPNSSAVPSCASAIGTLNYTVVTGAVATIDPTTNLITAQMPGTTAIDASLSGTGSAAGYFSTCPPASIKVALANGATTGAITEGVTQNLVTTVLDTNGNAITGLTLDYVSTNPLNLLVAGSGAMTANFSGEASIYAICQPSVCNPSPINVFGQYGTGLSIASNRVAVTVPGTASEYVWYGAPGLSQYVTPVDMLSGVAGSPIRLPYVPNSMIMDQIGANIYFGSSHELMTVSTFSNSLSKEDTTVPGVVLAVAPNNSLVLINDPVREVFYIDNPGASPQAVFGGLGTAAAWTPDSKTLYIADSKDMGGDHTDTLYVYNVNTGWTTYPLPPQHTPSAANPTLSASNPTPRTLAITVPSVGAYLSGTQTGAHTWCPSGTVGEYSSVLFYPQAPGDLLNTPTDVVAATNDGQHILGATVTNSGATLSDIGVTIPSTECQESAPTNAGAETMLPLATNPTLQALLNLNIDATAINQVVTSPVSNLAFVTYTNNGSTGGAALPYYVPGSGVIKYVPLTGDAEITAPVAGAFSPDNTLFFVSTAGDNMIHYIDIPTASSGKSPADTQQISPNLPVCSPTTDLGCMAPAGATGVVPATAIATKPRTTT
jgi:hypothetical protein